VVIVYPDHRTVAKRIRTTAAEVTSPFRPGARMKATVVETASLVSGGVMGTNQAPTAAADAYTTAEDTVLTVNTPGVLGNDSDPDGNTLSAVLGSGPSHGTLTLNANGSFTYTPAADYHGSDSFTYRTGDGSLTSNPVTVTLTVSATNDPPTVAVAAGGTCGTDDHSGTVKLTVADVDSPPAGLTLSAASSNPALVPTGNVVFAGSGAPRTMTVNAVDGRSDTAILTVTVSDGQASGTVWVTVTVGGSGKDTLTGSTGADLLLAQSNNDTLTGGGRQRPAVRRQRRRHRVWRGGRRQPGRRRPAHRRVGRGSVQRRHDPLGGHGCAAAVRRTHRSGGAYDRPQLGVALGQDAQIGSAAVSRTKRVRALGGWLHRHATPTRGREVCLQSRKMPAPVRSRLCDGM
jgi:VCBS repeat-containing protein